MTHTIRMPAYYTHYFIAQKTLRALPPTLKSHIRPSPALYDFGAQGADFCFFYRFFDPKVPNFGSYLHRKGAYEAFSVLNTLARNDALLRAYAIGYITHYAADVTFHPYVYGTAGRSRLKHSRIEKALDEYFKPLYRKNDRLRSPTLDEKERDELFFLYASIAAKCRFPLLRKRAFLRSISLFNAYTPIPSAIKKNKSLAFVSYAANEEKRIWYAPAAPDLPRVENATELFNTAVTLSVILTREFFDALKKNTPLPFSLFGKSYLTGLAP